MKDVATKLLLHSLVLLATASCLLIVYGGLPNSQTTLVAQVDHLRKPLYPSLSRLLLLLPARLHSIAPYPCFAKHDLQALRTKDVNGLPGQQCPAFAMQPELAS